MENNTFPNYVARQKRNKINARLGSPIACDFKNMLENQCKISISANANTQNTSHLNIGFADLPRCAHKPSPEAQQMLEVDIKRYQDLRKAFKLQPPRCQSNRKKEVHKN